MYRIFCQVKYTLKGHQHHSQLRRRMPVLFSLCMNPDTTLWRHLDVVGWIFKMLPGLRSPPGHGRVKKKSDQRTWVRRDSAPDPVLIDELHFGLCSIIL